MTERLPSDEWEAYLAGFLMTDGSARKDGKGIVLNQGFAHREVMELLAAHFDTPMHEYSYEYSYGVKRTLTIQFTGLPIFWAKFVPVPLEWPLACHYVRGLVDGDGCIDDKTNGRTTTRYKRIRMYVNDNQQHVLAFYSMFLQSFGIVPMYRRHAERVTEITVGRQPDVAALGRALYGNCTVSIRSKHEKALM